MDSLYYDYSAYDKEQIENGMMRNFYVLSVRYKSEYGDLKLDISRIKPTFDMDITDLSVVGSSLEVTLGATGLNPPFQWSFTYSTAANYDVDTVIDSFTTSNYYLLPDTSGSNLVFDIKVADATGLTSSMGYYYVNSGSSVGVDGTFSYTTI